MLSTISRILELEPKLEPLVKAAEDWDSFPSESKEQATFSYILSNYMEKTAQIWEMPAHVKRAAKMHGLKEPELNKIVNTLISQHLPNMGSRTEQALSEKAAEEYFFEKSAGEMRDIASSTGYSFDDPVLSLRAGQTGIEKRAAMDAVDSRLAATQDDRYLRLRTILEKQAEVIGGEAAIKIGDAFDQLDKATHLNTWGFDFYKEAAIKKYGVNVTLGKKTVSIETLLAKKSFLEKVVGENLPSNPNELKMVLDTLPLDLKVLIEKHI